MNQRQKIVDIAFSQIGYNEGQGNWTKYGDWYGLQDEWCNIFVSWCAYQAGISEDIIPKSAFVPSTADWFDARHEYKNSQARGGNYRPIAGDLILFDYNKNGTSDHIGIVVACDNNTVTTVEGNKDDSVKQCKYNLSDNNIRAYCVPKYEVEQNIATTGIYKNGSTKECVYSDTDCTHYVGYLNPYEQCDCLGVFKNRAIVRFVLDGTDNYKVGFCKWLEGVK